MQEIQFFFTCITIKHNFYLHKIISDKFIKTSLSILYSTKKKFKINRDKSQISKFWSIQINNYDRSNT